jgi:hypothetical protein
MNEAIRSHLAALNAAWQRYRMMEAPLDPVAVETLSRDYLAAWEGLDACGIAKWMLVYDPATLTFSLPATGVAHDAFATVPISAVTPRAAGSQGPGDEPHGARM